MRRRLQACLVARRSSAHCLLQLKLAHAPTHLPPCNNEVVVDRVKRLGGASARVRSRSPQQPAHVLVVVVRKGSCQAKPAQAPCAGPAKLAAPSRRPCTDALTQRARAARPPAPPSRAFRPPYRSLVD